jgi:sec-independent protein translocase protein TatA
VIPGVPQVGAVELIIVLSIILLFFGAKRIPELARSLGKGTREFRKGASEDAEALREQGELPEEDEKGAHSEGDQAEQDTSPSPPPTRASS